MSGATALALVGGATYVVLGLAVLWAAPRQAANRGFALYAVATGLGTVSLRLLGLLEPPQLLTPWILFDIALGLLTMPALVILARAFPHEGVPDGPGDRWVAVGVGALLGITWATWWYGYHRSNPLWGWEMLVSGHMEAATAAVMWWFLMLLALRARRHPDAVASLAVVSLAVGVGWCIRIGGLLAWAPPQFPSERFLRVFLGVVALGSLSAAWLRTLDRGTRSPWPFAVLWGVLGASLMGTLASFLISAWSYAAWDFTVGGLHILATVILAVAIARGQVPGLATRLRWGLSRGTIAAVFVAVFFVVSEGAQVLLGEENPWLGVLGAGALVFAIAPLQRVAERVAHAAVPVATPPTRAGDALTVYRTALEMAMDDGRVTREEERKLARIAHDLGLTPVEVLAVREAVEALREQEAEGP